MKSSLVIAGLVACAAPCLSAPVSNKVKRDPHAVGNLIVGGTEASPREFPWLGAIVSRGYTGQSAQFCGSSLLDATTVLTAAHCFMDQNGNQGTFASDISVELNRHDLNVQAGTGSESSAIRVNAASVTIHPSYSYATNRYDVAIIKLAQSVSGVPFARIPSSSSSTSSNPSNGAMMEVAGWGDQYNGANQGAPRMRKTEVPIVALSTCNSNYGGGIDQTMVCAGYTNGGRDTCQGDSGGPLFVETSSGPLVYGVSSFGAGCAAANSPGVYARLSNPTINSFIRTHSSASTGSGGSTSTATPTPSTGGGSEPQYCPAGCPDSWIGDGTCDSICNIKACAYDNGDCSSSGGSTPQYCPTSCPDNWIGDGYCDQACRIAACNYDGGDCDSVNASEDGKKSNSKTTVAVGVSVGVIAVVGMVGAAVFMAKRRSATAQNANVVNVPLEQVPASNANTAATASNEAIAIEVATDASTHGAEDVAV